MHEVGEGMCCFATEKDRVQKSGLKGGRRRGETSQQNKKAGAAERRARRETSGGEWKK